MIDQTKKYTTRDGLEVRIYATDGADPYVVHGSVKTGDGWDDNSWTADGFLAVGKQTCGWDLVEVRPRVRRTVWVNIYPNLTVGSIPCHSREDADSSAAKGRLACVRVDIDVEEGHGLSGDPE